MKFPTVESCCGCIELKTGGIILGILGILNSVSQLGKGTGILGALVGLSMCGLWIYGIHAERPSFLLPTIIFGAIGMICLYLLPFFVVLAVALFANDEKFQEFKQNENFHVYIILLMILYIVMAALATYFYIVEVSVYKHIKKIVEDRERNELAAYHQTVPLKYPV